jgi:ABC-type transport system substrate-binding protein
MRGAPLPGFRVVSSPFPAPVSGMELPTYGYDAKVEARAFDPRLAMALVALAENELKAKFEKQEKVAPKLTPVVLGYPADETSRIACRGLVKDWKRIGVEGKLLEFPAGKFDDAEQKCDLVYLQIQAWEPVTDAARLVGQGGLAPSNDEHVELALRHLQTARNWQQVRQRLVAIHRLMHEDVSLLPLWQTFDHFAYRKSLGGLKGSRLSLYQDVEHWQVGAQLAKGQP